MQQQAAAPNAISTRNSVPTARNAADRDREQTPRSAFATELAKVL